MVETVGTQRSMPLKGKELRKTNKPLMEKRRRARINRCLNQLKGLVLQAMNKDSAQYSKLEKADILEMTVNFLKAVPQQKTQAAKQESSAVLAKYNAGFNECASEVARYLGSAQGVDGQVRSRVLNHLSHRMHVLGNQNIPVVSSVAQQQPQQQQQQPSQMPLQPVYVQIPNTTPVIPGEHNKYGYPINSTTHCTRVSDDRVGHQGALIAMPVPVMATSVPAPPQCQLQQQEQQWYVMPISPVSSISSFSSSSRESSPVHSANDISVNAQSFSQHLFRVLPVPTNVELKQEELWRPW